MGTYCCAGIDCAGQFRKSVFPEEEQEKWKKQAKEEFEKKKEEFSEQLEVRLDHVAERIETAFDNVDNRLNQMKENMKKSPSLYLEDAREELAELRMKFHVQRESHRSLTDTLGTYKKSLIRNNPSMVSPRFASGLEELKKIAYKRLREEDQSEKEEK